RKQIVLGADDAVRAGAALELAARVRAQGVGGDGVGAVDHRPVEEGGDVVDLLARVAPARAGVGVELGTAEGDDLGTGVVGVEIGVAGRDGDVGALRLGALAGRGQVDVVVDELAPGVDPIGHETAVGQATVGVVGGE